MSYIPSDRVGHPFHFPNEEALFCARLFISYLEAVEPF